MVSEYAYDPEGFRVVKKAKGQTTHYVFQGTEPIFEKNLTTGKVKSFVYALGKHLARVDGAIGDTEAKKYWYVTDHVGSIRAVTDKKGKKVWSADYLAFGKQFGEENNADYPDFEELHSFTGKEYDPDTGLHYYNARWYDADLGRFVSEDPVADPNNPNLYSYTANNPLRFIDPTGLYFSDDWAEQDAADAENDSYFSSDVIDSWSDSVSGDSETTTEYESEDCKITKTEWADGTIQFNVSINWGANQKSGVSKETTRTGTFDRDGNMLSMIEVTNFSKPDSGSVEVRSVTAGNIKNTEYYMRDKNGNMSRGEVDDIVVIGLRGWGEGFQSKTMKARGENPYDDAFLVATRDGRVGFFGNVNLEGSTAKFTDDKGKYHDGTNPRIADGIYVLNYGLHKDTYEALHIRNANNGLKVAIQDKNVNYPMQGFYMYGAEIHKGGDGWNWSEGCLTVLETQWSEFMSYFDFNNGARAGTLIITGN